VQLSEGLEEISSMSFVGCSALESLDIPASVTKIAPLSVISCNALTDIRIADKNETYKNDPSGAVVDQAGETFLLYPAGLPDESYAVPEGIKSVASYAFSNAGNLKAVTLPDSVTELGEGVFSACGALESFTLPESLTAIPASLFADCTSLTSFDIPQKVTAIGDYAFFGCTGLTALTLPEGLQSLGEYALCDCTGLTELTVPDSVTQIGDYALGFRLETDETGEDKPVKLENFSLRGSADSPAQAYASVNKLSYHKTDLGSSVLPAVLISAGVVGALAALIVLRRNAKKKRDAAAAEAVANFKDPRMQILPDEDPYDRSYGITPDADSDTDDSEPDGE
jgi:hypothetical protein